MSLPCLPAAKAAYASLSYVMRTSPLPAKNVFAAFDADEACETTFLNSFVTNVIAFVLLMPDLPRLRRRRRGRSTSPTPEGNGSGVTTWTPGFVRSFQVWMCFGLPGRTTNATTELAAMPPCGVVVQLFATRPASASVSMSSPVERNAMSAGWPATIALACEPDGP